MTIKSHSNRFINRGFLFSALIPLCSSVALAQTTDEDTPFYLTLEPPPAVVNTAQQELNSFRLADGFRAELVVAEVDAHLLEGVVDDLREELHALGRNDRLG